MFLLRGFSSENVEECGRQGWNQSFILIAYNFGMVGDIVINKMFLYR